MSLAANRKANLVIAVTLVVFLSLLLSAYVLIKLNLNNTSNPRTIYSTEILDNVYAREAQISFFMKEIVGILPSESLTSRESFISALDEEIRKQQDSRGILVIPELSQVNNQLKVENVRIENGIAYIKLSFVIGQKLSDEGDEIFAVSHSFSKEFSTEAS